MYRSKQNFRIRPQARLLSLFSLTLMGFASSCILVSPGVHASEKVSKHWLIDAPDDSTRTQRLEKYLRGFDQPMWEVGERYNVILQAIEDKNYELASYHWEKIKTTINNGLMKRPARKQNADAILLSNAWQLIADDFASKDEKRAQAGLLKAKAACMACHQAEGVGFMNNQPLFTEAE